MPGLSGHPLKVHLNASPAELADSEYAGRILAALQRHQVPGDRMVVEVTETSIVDDTASTRENLDLLRSVGVAISIDDFGVGTSSLGRLHDSQVHQLKIDRSFIAELPDNRRTAAIVGMIVNLADTLGVEVVAEGIETEAQAAFLRSAGVRWCQGFLYARPMETADVSVVIERGDLHPRAPGAVPAD